MLSIGGCPQCGAVSADYATEPVIAARSLTVADVTCPAGHRYRAVWRSVEARGRAARMHAAAEMMATLRDRLAAEGRQGSDEYRIAEAAARRLPVLAGREVRA